MDTNEMRQDEEEDKLYDNATMLTTADTRKRNTSKAVQPPTTLPDLLQLLNRYRVFCNALWTPDSYWADDVNLLHRELTLNQRRLGIDPTTARRVTLEATWAVISEAHDFFARTTSKADLRRERPWQ